MTADSDSPKYITISDEDKGFSLKHFCIPAHYQDDLDHILIPSGIVNDRIERLACDIMTDLSELSSKDAIATLCVLKGGYKFFSDLLDEIKRINRTKVHSIPLSIDFIRLKSYVDTESGNVKLVGLENVQHLKDKHVLIVEDIIDTGKSMKVLLENLKTVGPKSIRVASLLVKRTPLSSGYRPDFTEDVSKILDKQDCGFEIPDRFVVGYALDYNEHFRDLSHICTINENGIKKYASSQ